ncbi:MAG: GGDEF domain-containing protein [Actinobacteria bacterium]|nr:GGDEF domain-containing protein [Actinomycetota bacterium]
MSETSGEIGVKTQPKPKFDPQLKARYKNVRPSVQSTIQKFQNPQDPLEHDYLKLIRKSSFLGAEEERNKAIIDETTQLLNHKWMQQELEVRFARAERKGTSFRIAIYDLDHFKWINDGYGHPVGDQVLRCIKDLPVRKEEPIARWGGEEFLQVLENHDSIENLAIAISRQKKVFEEATEKVLRNNNYSQQANPENKLDKVTMSIGIVEYIPGMSLEQLLKLADDALYKAKQKRNSAVYVNLGEDKNPVFTELKASENPSLILDNTL